jgi:hypothetical protein
MECSFYEANPGLGDRDGDGSSNCFTLWFDMERATG